MAVVDTDGVSRVAATGAGFDSLTTTVVATGVAEEVNVVVDVVVVDDDGVGSRCSS